jgi:hypothetical protein
VRTFLLSRLILSTEHLMSHSLQITRHVFALLLVLTPPRH